MLNAEQFPGSIRIDELADEVERFATRTTKAGADLGPALGDRKRVDSAARAEPHRCVDRRKGNRRRLVLSRTRTARSGRRSRMRPMRRLGLQELVRELAEWRLTEYLDRVQTQTRRRSRR